jgi:prepilin-type N-terminal cleavage/methylation domain-containing protein
MASVNSAHGSFPSSRPRLPGGFTLLEILAVIGILGLLVALTFPAFTKVQRVEEEAAISENLRLIAEAAQRYQLRTGNAVIQLENLVGSDKPIPQLKAVAGESYPEVIDLREDAITATGGAPGDVTYAY